MLYRFVARYKLSEYLFQYQKDITIRFIRIDNKGSTFPTEKINPDFGGLYAIPEKYSVSLCGDAMMTREGNVSDILWSQWRRGKSNHKRYKKNFLKATVKCTCT